MLTAAAAAVTVASPGDLPPVGVVGTVSFPILVLLLLRLRGAYRPRLRLQFLEDVRIAVTATALVAMAIITLRALFENDPQATGEVVRQWLFATVYLISGRLGLFLVEQRARAAGDVLRPTLIVGAGHVGRLIRMRLLEEPELGLKPVGYLDKEPLAAPPASDDLPVLGASWDLERVVPEHGVEHVIVSFSTAPHAVLLRLMNRCKELGVTVSQVPRLFETMTDRTSVERLGGLPLISTQPADLGGSAFALKSALDRVLSAVLLILALPLLGAVALAILLSMGRPVIFRQRRIGLDGQEFDILKFRTMVQTADESIAKRADWEQVTGDGAFATERCTRLGLLLRRASLDEFPQLFNVLAGDMSLVGPRPEQRHFVDLFREDVYRYKDRHRVKSGITGWAQVNEIARGRASVSKRVEWDNYYVENWSLWFDCKIILLTLGVIVRRKPLTSLTA